MNKFARYLFMVLFFFGKNETGICQLRPEILWQKCLGGSGDDRAQDVLINPDGTFMVVGSSTSNDGNVSGHHNSTDSADAWIVKLSAGGDVIWQKSIGGSKNDYFKTIIATNDNAYLCIGYTHSNNGDVSGNHGSADAWIVKISETGNIIWSKCYGGSQDDDAVKAIRTADGNYAVIGSSNSSDGDLATGENGAWVFKTDDSGNIIWTKGLRSLAGDNGYDIILSEDNNIYALASYNNYYTYTAGVPPVEYHLLTTPGKFYKLDNATGNSNLLATISSDSAYSMCRVGNSIKMSNLAETFFYLETCYTENFYISTKPDGSNSFTSQQVGSQFTRSCSIGVGNGNYSAPTHGLAAAETATGMVIAGTYMPSFNWSMHPKAWLSDISGFDGYYGGNTFANEETHFSSVKVFSSYRLYRSWLHQ